jgi:hypothetical protein
MGIVVLLVQARNWRDTGTMGVFVQIQWRWLLFAVFVKNLFAMMVVG